MSDEPGLPTTPRPTDPVAEAEVGAPETELAAPHSGPNRSDLDALKDGAAMMIQAGNRVAAMALLWSAVAIDPTDLAAHRRLAATLAHGGDLDGAADEYARYIEFMLPLGEVGRATLELQYGASMLGSHPALRDAAEKIVTAVRAIVAPTNVAIAPSTPATKPAAPAMAAPAMHAAAPATAPTAAAMRPRLLPKVPFRFCLHSDGERHWMQLEGGTPDLLPDAVRVIDADENVVETRLCIPLEPGDKGHARVIDDRAPSVAWVVVGVPSDVVAAFDSGRLTKYNFQARVGADWLSLELADTGCRLGRARPKLAAS